MFKRKPKQPKNPIDQPLLHFNDHDQWTMRDAFSGTLITGATGSGKTSGSGQSIRLSFLSSGMGGLVLTVKEDEAETWIEDARRTGRSDSLVIIDENAAHRLNYMQYEVARTGEHAGLTENLIGLFSDIMEAVDSSSGTRDEYWTRARDQLLRNTIDLALISHGTVDLSLIDRLILEAPTSYEALARPDLADKHYTARALVTANDKRDSADEVTARNIQMCNSYWFNEYPGLADRTRSSIVSTFRATSDLMNRGLLWQLFSTRSTIVPELSREGVIFIVNLPVKQFHESGIIAQVLFKYLWQRAMERPYQGCATPRPVFLWVDEYQNFAVTSDAMFQSTARSKQIATVYMFQNLPSLYLAMGGDRAKHAVDAILGNLATNIYHCNGDNTTNEWSANKIATILQHRYSTSTSYDDDQARPSVSTSRDRDHQVPPHTFTTLRPGGPRNDLTVDGIIFQAGRLWSNGANFQLIHFPQTP